MGEQSVRTFITGVGLVSPLGLGLDEHWEALDADSDGTSPQGSLLVPPFELEDYISSKKPYLDRHTKLGLLAAALALGEAGIEGQVPYPAESALVLSTAFGNHDSLVKFHHLVKEKGLRLASPLIFPHTYLNTTASMVAIEFGLRGHHLNFCHGASGTAHALLSVWKKLGERAVKLALVGGIDYPGELFSSSLPGTAPFEAAACLILESADVAGERETVPFCELQRLEMLSEPELDRADMAPFAEDELVLAASSLAAEFWRKPHGPSRVIDLEAIFGWTPAALRTQPGLHPAVRLWRCHSARLPLAVALAALCLKFDRIPSRFLEMLPAGASLARGSLIVVDYLPPMALVVRLRQANL